MTSEQCAPPFWNPEIGRELLDTCLLSPNIRRELGRDIGSHYLCVAGNETPLQRKKFVYDLVPAIFDFGTNSITEGKFGEPHSLIPLSEQVGDIYGVKCASGFCFVLRAAMKYPVFQVSTTSVIDSPMLLAVLKSQHVPMSSEYQWMFPTQRDNTICLEESGLFGFSIDPIMDSILRMK